MATAIRHHNKRAIAVQIIAFVACASSAYVSFHLLAKHLTGSFHSSILELGCSDSTEAGAANCGRVLESPYSYLPPKTDDLPEGRTPIPAAFVGLVYYTMLAVWFVGVGAPSRSRRYVLAIPYLIVGLGLAGSAYFMFIMFTKLEYRCSWCIVTHVLNVVIAACLVLMWPRASAEPPKPATVEERVSKGTRHVETYPSNRQVVATLAAMYLVWFGQGHMLQSAHWRGQAQSKEQNLADCMTVVNRLKADVDKMMSMWERQDKHDFKLGPDDPVRLPNPTGPALEVVVFSDLECPHCKKFAILLEERIQPLFDGHLKVAFKHFPLNEDCNQYIKKTIHLYACHAAMLAEGARLQMGSDGFWKTHDYLYENYKRLKDVTPEDVARHVGLDVRKLESDMSSKVSTKRIYDDTVLGRSVGVSSTPTIFVNGKLVEPISRRDLDFWNAMANLYWRTIRQPRPQKTLLPNVAATPDSQDQSAAP